MDAIKNFARAQVAAGYDAAAVTLALIPGQAARLPAAPFNATWWNATDFPDPTDDPGVEIVRVTAVVSDNLTLTRGQEGTGASAKNTAGKVYKLEAGLTAGLLATLVEAVEGAAGAAVKISEGKIYFRDAGDGLYYELVLVVDGPVRSVGVSDTGVVL